MKASRAYIAGLGTSGVLIASFLLLLMVGSAIVAFHGAPGQASNDGLDRLDVSHDGRAGDAPRSERPDGGQAASHRGGRGERGGARGRDPRRAGAGSAAGLGATDGHRAAGGLTGGVSRGGDAAASGGSSAGGGNRGEAGLPLGLPQPGATPTAPSAGDVADGLGDTVERTTRDLGDTVGRAAPPLEAPVVQTGEAVSGVTEQAAPVLDSTVNGVTGAVGGATERVGGATDGLTGAAP